MATHRRRLLQLLGAAAGTALAGCSTASDGTTATTATGESLPGLDEFSYPAGFDVDGVTGTERAVETQTAFLTGVSGYTSTLTIEYRTNGDVTGETLSKIEVDSTEETVLWRYDDHAHDKELVFTDGTLTVYSLESESTMSPEESALFGGEPPDGFRAVSLYHESEFLGSIFENFEFDAEEVIGTETGPAVRYAVTGMTDSQSDYYDETDGEMVVLGDAGVLYFESTAIRDGESTEANTSRYEISALGDTDVELPDWASE